jgi:uncharacterized protein YecE (DUF72 family)
MKRYVGTSGFSYKEWKGSFYPEKFPEKQMLGYYAERLTAVEINNTFYRMPRASVLENWSEQVPDSFRFIIKASRKITHFGRLQNVGDETEYLVNTIGTLGKKLGALLFQLPGNFKQDLARLDAFLQLLPAGTRAAFEFRHASWFEDATFDLLRQHECALCLADTEEEPLGEIHGTAAWGYLRLRREEYNDAELKAWLDRLEGQGFEEAFVFFKHEDAGAGPALAKRFMEL